jgi:hypothetical protein
LTFEKSTRLQYLFMVFWGDSCVTAALLLLKNCSFDFRYPNTPSLLPFLRSLEGELPCGLYLNLPGVIISCFSFKNAVEASSYYRELTLLTTISSSLNITDRLSDTDSVMVPWLPCARLLRCACKGDLYSCCAYCPPVLDPSFRFILGRYWGN